MMRGLQAISRRGLVAASVGLWAVMALGSCSAAPQNAPSPEVGNRSEPHLFEAVYRAVSGHYLHPMSAETLAVAGLNSLNKIDGSLSVSQRGKSFALMQNHDTLLEREAPAADDNRGWGDLVGAMLQSARQHS